MSAVRILLSALCVLAVLLYSSICPVAAQEPWPTKVPVLRPDPVLGNQRVWEYWVYDDTFAQRFAGFDRQHVNKDLNPGVFAIAFRTYKRRTYGDLDLYHCEYEIYFDQVVQIPLSTREAIFSNAPGVSPGLYGLRPHRDEDAIRLSSAEMVQFRLRSAPFIVADGKVDGRYAWFGAFNYFTGFVEGMSMVSLKSDFLCKAIAPKRPGSRYWISLFGEMAFDQALASDAIPWALSARFQKWFHTSTFDPGPPEKAIAKGFIRVPEELYANVLPKVALIQSMNECITWRSSKSYKADPNVLAACEGIEERGEVRHFSARHIFIGRPHHF